MDAHESKAMGLEVRLKGLARAALVMGMNGWTPERATLDPEEEWSAGEVVATACTEGGETMVYSLHLDPDGDHWWHSIEMIFAQSRRWAKSPSAGNIAVDEVARQLLADRCRAKEEVDEEFHRLLKVHVNQY